MRSALRHTPSAADLRRLVFGAVGIPKFTGGLLEVGMYAGPIELSDPDHDDDDDGPAEIVSIDTHLGWVCTREEMHQRFVTEYPMSGTRRLIDYELTQHVLLASAMVPCALFMISGAFVADLDDPYDAHMTVVVTGRALSGLSPNQRWQFERTFGDRSVPVSDEVNVTLGFVAVYPTDHSRYSTSLVDIATARHMCRNPLGDDRDGGYLHLRECEGGGPDGEIIALLAGSTPAL